MDNDGGKFVDLSTGALELNAASKSSSSCVVCREIEPVDLPIPANGLLMLDERDEPPRWLGAVRVGSKELICGTDRPLPKTFLALDVELPDCIPNCFALCSSNSFCCCCSVRPLAFDDVGEARRLAKLSLVRMLGLDGFGDDKGVDLPDIEGVGRSVG